MSSGIIEAGSLDLDEVNLRVENVKVDPKERRTRFVVVEHFVSPEGERVDEERFDVKRMCLSLFIAPVNRHKKVLNKVPPDSGLDSVCLIAGGGHMRNRLTFDPPTVHLFDKSIDFGGIPPFLCRRFETLMLDKVRDAFDNQDIVIKDHAGDEGAERYYDDEIEMSNYWLQFRQVYEASGYDSGHSIVKSYLRWQKARAENRWAEPRHY